MLSYYKYFTVLFLVVCFFAKSAEINVAPGQNTLEQAIASASEGDTLVLTNGQYGSSKFYVDIDKSLTIKADSKSQAVEIRSEVRVPIDIELDHLVLQGLTLLGVVDSTSAASDPIYESILIRGEIKELTLLENEYIRKLKVASNNIESITFIGNKSTCHPTDSNTRTDLRANKIYFFGNDICGNNRQPEFTGLTSDSGVYLELLGTSPELFMIGNKLELRTEGVLKRVVRVQFESSGVSNIFSNRFKISMQGDGELISYRKPTYAFFNFTDMSGDTYLKNNIFSLDSKLVVGEVTVPAIKLYSGSAQNGRVSFVNNIVDFADVGITESSVNTAFNAELQRFEGNILVNYNDKLMDDGLSGYAKNNLCFNNTENCSASNGNLNADPMFTAPENGDYSLQAGSPAINTGSDELVDYDVDGTRNDMGAYSGSWSIEQYDAQRAEDALGPYVYPLMSVNNGVANGKLNIKFISYPRLK